MTYLIAYLSELKFIFETVLGYVSGDQMGSFEAKKRSQKSHAWAPLKRKYIRLLDCSGYGFMSHRSESDRISCNHEKRLIGDETFLKIPLAEAKIKVQKSYVSVPFRRLMLKTFISNSVPP